MGITSYGRYLPPRQTGFHHTHVDAWSDFYGGMRHTPHHLTGSSGALGDDIEDTARFVASTGAQLALLATAGVTGRAAWKVIQASRAKRFADFVVFMKRPLHEMAVGASHWGVWASRTPSIVPTMLRRTLTLRKGIGLTGLGMSIINPLENVRYIQKKDWKRLAINLRFPFVGVPIYDWLQGRSGSPPPVASPTNQPVRILRDEDRHRRTQSARNRQRAPRPRSVRGGSKWEPKKISSRPSGRPSRAKRVMRAKRARKKCPAGHYYSWKLKRCVKSKYR